MGYAQCAEEVNGWMTPDELRLLRNYASQCESVIEIGSWKGRSSWALLESCKGPVYCVDSWQGADDGNYHAYDELAHLDVHGVFLDNVGHFPNLNVVKGISWEVAGKTPPQVDMVFIDADHSFGGCLADIKAYGPKATKFLLGHDYSWAGVQQALNAAFPRHQYSNPVGDIWVASCELPWSMPKQVW
jgi:hypothetical protein